jgi:hypothetical protein
VFKPHLAPGARRFAPLCAPRSALNPCVQARSRPGAPSSLFGRRRQTFGVAASLHGRRPAPALGGPTGVSRAGGAGAPSRPRGRRAPPTAPLSVPPIAPNPCVQAESRTGATVIRALSVPRRGRNPCIQARSRPRRASPSWARKARMIRPARVSRGAFGADGVSVNALRRRLGCSSRRRDHRPSLIAPLPCPPHPQSLCSSRSCRGATVIRALSVPLEWPQSLCSSQIRPEAGRSLFGKEGTDDPLIPLIRSEVKNSCRRARAGRLRGCRSLDRCCAEER